MKQRFRTYTADSIGCGVVLAIILAAGAAVTRGSGHSRLLPPRCWRVLWGWYSPPGRRGLP
jgi:hypothetical protein